MSATVELSMSDDLLNAFVTSDYLVDIDENRLCVRIGQGHITLDRALKQRSWAILTTDNPGARELGETDNQARRALLVSEATQAGLTHFPSTHRASASDWNDEHGLLLLDPPSEWLHAQARRFGQLGIVHGRPGQPAELWLYASLNGAPAPSHVRQVYP